MLFGKKHIERYVETDGAEGHDWEQGSSVLLLTTTGSKSGEPRITPLIYGRSGDDYLVVASNGGSTKPPSWYVNLRKQPDVEVQVKGARFRARARDATPEEKPEVWQTMVGHWPSYDDYQQRTERPIPVVVLERA